MSGNNKFKSKLETKLDHKTLHYMPFMPSRKRQKDFKLTTQWKSDLFLEITANETVNTTDLITLGFITRAYLEQSFIKAGEIKGREIAEITIDLERAVKERDIKNEKNNRNTFFKSIRRLWSVELMFFSKERKDKPPILTRYFYEIEPMDWSLKQVKIYANKRYIEHILDKGITVNLSNFVELENINLKRYKEHAILLFAYLLGTKTMKEFKNRKIPFYKERYSENELFNTLKLNFTQYPDKEKRRIVKECFKILHKYLDLPEYIYNPISKNFERKDLIEKRLKVN